MNNIKKILERYNDSQTSGDYVDANTLEKYLELPVSARTSRKWYWPGPWYKTPRSMTWNHDDWTGGNDWGEWGKFHKWASAQYPVQAFIRNDYRDLAVFGWCLRVKWWLSDLRYAIKTVFRPCHKSLRKQIPRRWRDLTTIIPDVLYAAIISYVEEEKCFERLVWDDNPERKAQGEMIKEIYQWAKTGRDIQHCVIDSSYPKRGDKSENRYDKHHQQEKILNDKDDRYLAWIVANREYLWT